MLLEESVTPDALKKLKDSKVTAALIKNILMKEIQRVLQKISEFSLNFDKMIAVNPEKIETLFEETAAAKALKYGIQFLISRRL